MRKHQIIFYYILLCLRIKYASIEKILKTIMNHTRLSVLQTIFKFIQSIIIHNNIK